MTATLTAGHITPHFSVEEVACRCCGTYNAEHALELCSRLEKVRAVYGPMPVSSGCRCREHNLHEGGAWNSFHITTEAADIYVNRDSDRFKIVRLFIQEGFRGIGVGRGLVHADIRTGGVPVMWTYPTRG